MGLNSAITAAGITTPTLSGDSTGLLIDADSNGLIDFVRVNPINDVASQTGNLYGNRTIFELKHPGTTETMTFGNGAVVGQVLIDTANAHPYTNRLSGLYGYIHHAGSGLVTDARGTYTIGGTYGTGNITNCYGVYSYLFAGAGASGKVVNAYEFYAAPFTNDGSGGAPSVVYSFYSSAQTAGVLNYAFYGAGTTPSLLNGNLTANGFISTADSTLIHTVLTDSTIANIGAMDVTKTSLGSLGYRTAVSSVHYASYTAANFVGEIYGLLGTLLVNSGNNKNWTGAGTAQNDGGAVGVLGRIEVRGSVTGTITILSSFLAQLDIATGPTVTNAYGMRISNPAGAGTPTNCHGIHIDAQTKGGTTNYAIFTAGAATSVFGGGIITGDTVFMHQTNVTLANGAAAQAGTLLNAPAAGNPTKWIAINDNGTIRYIPAW